MRGGGLNGLERGVVFDLPLMEAIGDLCVIGGTIITHVGGSNGVKMGWDLFSIR